MGKRLGRRRKQSRLVRVDFRKPDLTSKFWRIFVLQRERCYLCTEPFTNDDWATEDHVRPKWVGATRFANTLLAHKGCNAAKGGRMPYPCEALYLLSVNLGLPEVYGGIARDRRPVISKPPGRQLTEAPG